MDEDEQNVIAEDDEVEEGDVHTPENPYCWDLECWCHTDVEYHSMVQFPTCLDEDVELAYSFYEVSQ